MKWFRPKFAVLTCAMVVLAGGFLILWNRARRPAIEFSPTPQSSSTSPTITNSSLWTQFRGPRQGDSGPSRNLPLIWSENTNATWKTELPGNGWSSPAVSADKVWVTSALENGRSLRALALDKRNGKVLINQEIFTPANAAEKHTVNSHASPSPALDDDKVFVAFGPKGIACLDASNGNVVWKNTELKFDDENMGGGASPILTSRFVVIHCDGTDERFIVALDKATGRIAWRTPRSNVIKQATPFRKAFSTPILSSLNGVEQLISSCSYRVFGYDVETGRELWAVETPGFCPVPTPLVKNDWIFVCTGFDKAQLYAFHKENGKAPDFVWKTMRSAPLVPSPVLVDHNIYMVSDSGIASCVDASSGRSIWNERISGKYWASLLHSEGRIYAFAEDGSTTVLAAASRFEVLARNRLDGEIMATPAIADDAFFLRTKTHLYRLQGTGPPAVKPTNSEEREVSPPSNP